MKVQRMASSPIVSVTPDRSVHETLVLMNECEISSVAVLEKDRLIGIFTVRDLARKITMSEMDLRATPVGDVMTTEVKWVYCSTPIGPAITLMLENHIHHLPVLDKERRVKGMVSLQDLLSTTIENLEVQLESLDAYISCDCPGG